MVVENSQEKQEISQINLTSVGLKQKCVSKIDLKTVTNTKLTRNPYTERTAGHQKVAKVTYEGKELHRLPLSSSPWI